MRGFLVTLVLLMALPAYAQVGAPAGGSYNWVKLGKDQKAIELGTPMTGVSYHVPFENGTEGVSFNHRISVALDDGTGNGVINKFTMDYWKIRGPLEWFVGGGLETWGEAITGDTEFLIAGDAGFRFSAAGLPLQVSGNYAKGGDGIQDVGVFFGLHVESQPEEE